MEMLFNFEGSGRVGQREIEKRREGGRKNGGVAQLGEHLPCKQGVMGSNPIISTRKEEGPSAEIRAHSSAG